MTVASFTVGTEKIYYDTATGQQVAGPGGASTPAAAAGPVGANGLPLGQLRTADGTTSFVIGPDGKAVIVAPGEVQGLLARGYTMPNADQQAWVQNEQAFRNPGYYATNGATAVGSAGVGSAPATQPTPSSTIGTPGQAASYTNILQDNGLGDLAPFVDGWIRQGLTWDQVWLQLNDPSTGPGKIVDQIYPELAQRRAKGLTSSIAEIRAFRSQTAQLFAQDGINLSDLPSRISNWYVNDTSLSEISSRLDDVKGEVTRIAMHDPQAAAELDAYQRFYNVNLTQSDLVNMALDFGTAEPVIRARGQAVALDTQAQRGGFGDLTRTEAETLAGQGVTPGQAAQSFGFLGGAGELLNPLTGTGQDAIGRDEQIALVAGNANAARRVRQRQAQDAATFQGGGSFATGKSGYEGIGAQR